jgi:hypothetical protein
VAPDPTPRAASPYEPTPVFINDAAGAKVAHTPDAARTPRPPPSAFSRAKRRAWGNYNLHCVLDDGRHATQADGRRELGLDKTRVSHTIADYERRGYIRTEGKLIYPEVEPKPVSNTEKSCGLPQLFGIRSCALHAHN